MGMNRRNFIKRFGTAIGAVSVLGPTALVHTGYDIWPKGYAKRQPITINHKMVSADLTDFQVYIERKDIILDGDLFFRTKLEELEHEIINDGADILVTTDLSATEDTVLWVYAK